MFLSNYLHSYHRGALLILICFLFTYQNLHSQVSYRQMMNDYSYNFYDVVDAAEEYFASHPKGKGSGYKQYMRWRMLNEGKYAPSGDRKHVDHRISVKSHQAFMKNTGNKKSQLSVFQELGPDYSAWHYDLNRPNGVGRVEAFWINPDDEDEMFLSSRSGGFWKTTNGGNSWYTTTDDLIAPGVNTFTVNPFNTNEILINVQTFTAIGGGSGSGQTQGIYRSLDRGETWETTNFTETDGFKIALIEYHPRVKNLVLIGSDSGLYKSTDNLNTFDLVYIHFLLFYDIEFHPTDNAIIYAMSEEGSHVIRSTDFGDSFNQSGFITEVQFGQHIDVSPASPDNVWCATTNGIWQSTDSGQNFSFVTAAPAISGEFAVSDTNPEVQILGYIDLYRSTNDTTFVQSTSWNNYEVGKYIHADLRTIESQNGVFYAGTDGYLVKTEDGGINWSLLNETGTGIRENYFLTVSQGNNEFYMTGSQDNGTTVHYGDENWFEVMGGDGVDCIIHPLNNSWLISSTQTGSKSFRKEQGRESLANSSIGNWHEPLIYDHNDPMHLITFEGTKIHEASDYNMNWTLKGDHGIGKVDAADISYQNSDLIAAVGCCNIMLSQDGGENWSDKKSNIDVTGFSDIKFNPKDDNNIVVSSKAYSGFSKLYMSQNRGDSWQDIAYNLGNMPVLSIEIDHATPQNIYVGTELGIFTMPINGASWSKLEGGLPNAPIRDMEIHYGSNELFVATIGRGTWKTNLVNRSTHPKITTTTISDGPTFELPVVGSNQYVTSTIESPSSSLTNVEVLWSEGDASFTNSITMTNIGGNTWRSATSLPTNSPNSRIFFKVQATGSNNDISETYKFSYKAKLPGSFNPISVEEPTLNAQHYQGEALDIRWNATTVSGNMALKLFKGDQFVWQFTPNTANDGFHTVTIPQSIESGNNYKVEVSSRDDPSIKNYSEIFPIGNQADGTVITPTLGTTWEQGDQVEYRWSIPGSNQNLRVELHKGGVLAHMHTTNTAQDGFHMFNLPQSLEDGNNYTVKLCFVNTDSCIESEQFTIQGPPLVENAEINFLFPNTNNGTLQFLPGENLTIDWEDNIPDRLILSLYKHGSATPTLIDNNVPASISSYQYSLPGNLANGLYKFRIVHNDGNGNTQVGVNSDLFIVGNVPLNVRAIDLAGQTRNEDDDRAYKILQSPESGIMLLEGDYTNSRIELLDSNQQVLNTFNNQHNQIAISINEMPVDQYYLKISSLILDKQSLLINFNE